MSSTYVRSLALRTKLRTSERDLSEENVSIFSGSKMQRIKLPNRDRTLPKYSISENSGKNFKFVKYSKITDNPLPLPAFIDFVQDIVTTTRPVKVSFMHTYSYVEFDMGKWADREFFATQFITYTPSKHGAFGSFVSCLMERRFHELFGDDYQTYNALTLMSESIDASTVIAIHNLPGRGGVRDCLRSAVIGNFEYLLRSCDGPEDECFFNVLRRYSPRTDELMASLDMSSPGIHPDDLEVMEPNLHEMGLCIETLVDGVMSVFGSGLHVRMLCVDAHWWEVIESYSCVTQATDTDMGSKFFTYDFETVADEPYMFSTYDPESGARVIETETPGCPQFLTKVASVLAQYEARGYTGVGFNSNFYDDLFLLLR